MAKLKDPGECSTEGKKGGAWFASALIDLNRLNAASVATLYREQETYDDERNPAQGVDIEAMTAAMHSISRKMTAPGTSTDDIERALSSSAVLLGNLITVWLAYAAGHSSLNAVGLYSHLALKAQEQQRKTLATLATIRNPKRVAFVKQLNQAVNQQVNNGENSSVAAIPEKNAELRASELLEVIPSERLDTRTQSEAIISNPRLEALDAQHRPENRRREG